MNKTKKLYFIFNMCLAIFGNAWILMAPGLVIGAKIVSVIGIAAALIAFVYIKKGYGKDVAHYYKAFMLTTSFIFLVSGMSNLINMSNGQNAIIAGIISFDGFLAYSMLFLLAFANDLGEKTSKRIANIILIFSAVLLVADIIFAPGVFRGGDLMASAIMVRNDTKFMMSMIVRDMVHSKYLDKKRRYTK